LNTEQNGDAETYDLKYLLCFSGPTIVVHIVTTAVYVMPCQRKKGRKNKSLSTSQLVQETRRSESDLMENMKRDE
jgi:hypothetical protein